MHHSFPYPLSSILSVSSSLPPFRSHSARVKMRISFQPNKYHSLLHLKTNKIQSNQIKILGMKIMDKYLGISNLLYYHRVRYIMVFLILKMSEGRNWSCSTLIVPLFLWRFSILSPFFQDFISSLLQTSLSLWLCSFSSVPLPRSKPIFVILCIYF